ncbi:MAG: GGDEF domain-containing protein [Saccharofermentans sp.]|nr:GGDEF domain-containing protein [Saccharofermentans sp.]
MKGIDATNLSPEDITKLESFVLNTIKNYSVDTIYFKDRNSKFLWNSKGHSNQVGEKDPADMRGKSDFDYFPEEFAQIALDVEKKIMETGEPVNDANEVWYKSDDEIVYLMSSKYPLYDEDGEIVGTWGVTRDITELKVMEHKLDQAYQKIQRYTRVDDLTGLYNRRYYTEYTEKIINIIEKRGDGRFAIVAIDVDDMAHINAQYNQACGDNLLRLVASNILINIDKTSTAFRNGDDEFVVLMPDADIEEAVELAKKIQKSISSEPLAISGMESERITASIGIAEFTQGMSITELMSSVDRKLFKAKRAGKNQLAY